MLETLAIVLIFTGLLFDFGGTIGILRLPDVYTRLHMAGKLDTLGSMCLLLGLALVTAMPLGKAELVRVAEEAIVAKGQSLLVVSYGMGVHWTLNAIKSMEGQITLPRGEQWQ
jgi:monovalent cation/proton antiporter MnhG/PhaG subunit